MCSNNININRMNNNRLTRKSIDGKYKVDASVLSDLDGRDLVILEYSGIIQKVIDRLAFLEDKIDSGELQWCTDSLCGQQATPDKL